MESRDILVEVDREEVETAGAAVDGGFVVLHHIVEVVGSLRGDGPNLLVASGVARDKKNGYPFELDTALLASRYGLRGPSLEEHGQTYLGIVVDALLPIQIQRVFAGESGVLRIEVVESRVRGAHVGHAAPLRLALSCSERVEYRGQEGNAQERDGQCNDCDGPGAS